MAMGVPTQCHHLLIGDLSGQICAVVAAQQLLLRFLASLKMVLVTYKRSYFLNLQEKHYVLNVQRPLAVGYKGSKLVASCYLVFDC